MARTRNRKRRTGARSAGAPPAPQVRRTQERRTRESAPTRRRDRQPRWGLWAAAAIVAAVGTAIVYSGRDGGSPDRPFVGGDIHSLVVDPNNAARIYVGGHQAVAVSVDGGKSWRPVESLDGADAMGWAFVDGRVLVSGHPGLNVSENGVTFERRNEGLPATDIHSLGAGSSTIYAGSPVAGLLTSTDQGSSWQVVSNQIGHSFFGRILVDPRDDQHVLAADAASGVLESTDGGRSWRRLGGLSGASWVAWDREDPQHIVASKPGSAVASIDGGATWETLDIPEGAWLVEMSPSNPDALFAAVHEGTTATIWVSSDGGGSWSRP